MLFLFMALTFALSLVRESIAVEGFTFPLVLGFLWGLSLYFLEGWIFVCCTKVYHGHIETYAIAKQMHTSSFILFQVYQVIFRNHDVVNQTILLLLVLSIFSALVTHFLLASNEQQQLSQGCLKEKDYEETMISHSDDN